MTQRRITLLVAAVIAAAAATLAGAMWATGGSPPLPQGPLACPGCGSNLLATPVEVGKPFAYSLLILVNHGRHTAVLEKVELLRISRGFKVLRIAIRRPYQPVLAASPEFPPARGRGLRDVRGFRVRPHGGPAREGQLVVGMRIDRRGIYKFNGIAVSYHVGRQGYRAILKAGFVVCGPRAAYRGGCPRSAQQTLPP
jgi:hypothetical protein